MISSSGWAEPLRNEIQVLFTQEQHSERGRGGAHHGKSWGYEDRRLWTTGISQEHRQRIRRYRSDEMAQFCGSRRTPVPTTSDANCKNCDPQPSPVPVGTIGLFVGLYVEWTISRLWLGPSRQFASAFKQDPNLLVGKRRVIQRP
jgi:hypothetical protein